MSVDREEIYHRTMIPFDASKEDYSPRLIQKPVDLRAWTYVGFQLVGGAIRKVWMKKKRDQRFEDYATPWEQTWSYLYKFIGSFFPVVDDQWTVVGHYGSVGGGYFTNLIVPRAAVPAEAVYARLDTYETYYTDDLNALLKQGVPVFVHVRKSQPAPDGWVVCDALTTEHNHRVMTTVDGEVIDSVSESTGFLVPVSYSPMDFLVAGTLLVRLGKAVGTRIAKSIIRVVAKRASRGILEGPTARLAKDVAELLGKNLTKREATALFKGLRLGRGYDPRMGIPEEHFLAMVDAAKETQTIAMFRANKAAAIPLIRKGAPGKPMWAKFKTSPETGVLTANNFGEVAAANAQGYFVVGADGVARKVTTVGGKTVTEVLKMEKPFWTVKPGQVIAKDGKPVVGDYDLLGVAPVKSPGSSVALVPEDVAYGDWNGPWVKKYADAVNKPGRLDQPRVLHGAQDQYGGNPKYMGLTDDTAYAVFPDGRSLVLEGRQAQQAFYDTLGRKAKSPGPVPVGNPDWKPTIVR